MEYRKLMEPGKIGSMELKNRFVVPPMGTNYAESDGKVTDKMIAYYKKRAEGGFALIIIEVVAIDKKGKAIVNQVGLWEDSQIEGFRKLCNAIHEAGAKVVLQLHHAGRQTVPFSIYGETPEAPSKIACPVMDSIPNEMTEDRIWEVINEFGDAAVRAKEAGADGVEVHGAHGYLVAQFMSTHANKRIDDWGGDFEGRMRFPREIFRNIRSKVGNDYPMLFRFGYDEKVFGGRTLEESVAVARMAEEETCNALDISIMTYASMEYMSASPAMPAGFNQFPTREIKNSVNIPVITVGRYSPVIAENALLNGCADFVAFGRESLADPDLPEKVINNKLDELIPCIGCTQSCIGYIFVGAKASCLVNPLTGHEDEYNLSKANKIKNVLIVGSGPAGLEAAIILAIRGHKVTVCEKQSTFGGQFRLAAIPPTKHEISTAIKYYIHKGKKLGVTYLLNTEVDSNFIKEYNPDAVILATGGVPSKPKIPGIDGKNVIQAVDILDGKVVPGRNVLIIGGGLTGVETADFLSEHNRNVTIIEMRGDIALDEAMIPRAFLMPRLEKKHVKKICKATVQSIKEDGIIYNQDGKTEVINGFDTIVLAMGVKSYNPLEKEIKSLVKEVYVIGDADKVGTANHATEAGLAAALKI